MREFLRFIFGAIMVIGAILIAIAILGGLFTPETDSDTMMYNKKGAEETKGIIQIAVGIFIVGLLGFGMAGGRFDNKK